MAATEGCDQLVKQPAGRCPYFNRPMHAPGAPLTPLARPWRVGRRTGRPAGLLASGWSWRTHGGLSSAVRRANPNLLAWKTQIWTVRQLMVRRGEVPPRVIFISSPNLSFSRSGGCGWLTVRRMGVVTGSSGADARPINGRRSEGTSQECRQGD